MYDRYYGGLARSKGTVLYKMQIEVSGKYIYHWDNMQNPLTNIAVK